MEDNRIEIRLAKGIGCIIVSFRTMSEYPGMESSIAICEGMLVSSRWKLELRVDVWYSIPGERAETVCMTCMDHIFISWDWASGFSPEIA